MTPGRPGSGLRRAAGSEITENRLVRDRGSWVNLLNGALAEGAHSLGLGSSTYGPRSDARGRRGGGVPATSQSNKGSPNGFICARPHARRGRKSGAPIKRYALIDGDLAHGRKG